MHSHDLTPRATGICMCSVEVTTQDLGPEGRNGGGGKCRVRTRSFGWRVRLGDLPCYRGIWGRSQLDCGVKEPGRVGRWLRLTCHMRRLCYSTKIYKWRKAASALSDPPWVEDRVVACNAISACSATCDIPEPAIRFAIMRAAATAGKLSAGNDAQVLLGL